MKEGRVGILGFDRVGNFVFFNIKFKVIVINFFELF